MSLHRDRRDHRITGWQPFFNLTARDLNDLADELRAETGSVRLTVDVLGGFS
ncbi:MAG TPA: hypothetical protein VIJ50_02870 [Solirubrobacteraceae bacterium]